MAHADKYSAAFHTADMERIEKGQIPEKDMWKYSSFWYKDFDGMAMKTMLRQLISKWGIMSIDLQTAIEKDMAVINEDGNPEYIENEEQGDNVAVDQEYREAGLQEDTEQMESSLQESDGQMSMEDEFFRGL